MHHNRDVDLALVERPSSGYVYTTGWRLATTDIDEHQQLRLDGVARYIQEVVPSISPMPNWQRSIPIGLSCARSSMSSTRLSYPATSPFTGGAQRFPPGGAACVCSCKDPPAAASKPKGSGSA